MCYLLTCYSYQTLVDSITTYIIQYLVK